MNDAYLCHHQSYYVSGRQLHNERRIKAAEQVIAAARPPRANTNKLFSPKPPPRRYKHESITTEASSSVHLLPGSDSGESGEDIGSGGGIDENLFDWDTNKVRLHFEHEEVDRNGDPRASKAGILGSNKLAETKRISPCRQRRALRRVPTRPETLRGWGVRRENNPPPWHHREQSVASL